MALVVPEAPGRYMLRAANGDEQPLPDTGDCGHGIRLCLQDGGACIPQGSENLQAPAAAPFSRCWETRVRQVVGPRCGRRIVQSGKSQRSCKYSFTKRFERGLYLFDYPPGWHHAKHMHATLHARYSKRLPCRFRAHRFHQVLHRIPCWFGFRIRDYFRLRCSSSTRSA